MSAFELIAAELGFACVLLTLRQHIGCWPTGLAQVIMYIPLFHAGGLYVSMALHVIYVPTQLYGWYHWWRNGGRPGDTFPVTAIAGGWLVFAVALTVFGTAALAITQLKWLGVKPPDGNHLLLYGDAFVGVASLTAMWLMAFKKLESWFFWIAVDVVGIGVYLGSGLYPTAALYSAFLVLATMGLLAWRSEVVSCRSA